MRRTSGTDVRAGKRACQRKFWHLWPGTGAEGPPAIQQLRCKCVHVTVIAGLCAKEGPLGRFARIAVRAPTFDEEH